MVHRRLSELSSKVPFGFTFRELKGKSGSHGSNFSNARNSGPRSNTKNEEGNWVRIYFLSSLSQTSETSLFYCDVDLNHDYLSKEAERERERFRESMPTSHQSPQRNSPSSSYSSELSSRSPIASASDNNSIHPFINHSSPNDLVPNSSPHHQPDMTRSPRPNYYSSVPIASSFLGDVDPAALNISPVGQIGMSVSSPGPVSSASQSEGSFGWVPLIESSKYTRMCITRSSTSGSSSGSSSSGRPGESDQNAVKSPNGTKDPSNRRKPQHHEEKLQMERKRIMITGITSYEYDHHSNRFVFGSGGKLFFFDDQEYETRPLPSSPNFSYPPYIPRKVHSDILMSKVNPQICPSNPDLLAYLCDGDIWVTNLKSGHEVRLTATKLISEEQDRCVSAGLPSYVIQEEFRR